VPTPTAAWQPSFYPDIFVVLPCLGKSTHFLHRLCCIWYSMSPPCAPGSHPVFYFLLLFLCASEIDRFPASIAAGIAPSLGSRLFLHFPFCVSLLKAPFLFCDAGDLLECWIAFRFRGALLSFLAAMGPAGSFFSICLEATRVPPLALLYTILYAGTLARVGWFFSNGVVSWPDCWTKFPLSRLSQLRVPPPLFH